MAVIRTLVIALIVLIAAGLAAVAFSPVGQSMLPVGAGIAAKQLCSLTFVSKLEPEDAWDLYVGPLLGTADQFARYDIDAGEPSVTVTVAFAFSAKAVHRPRVGCTLVRDETLVMNPAPVELGLMPAVGRGGVSSRVSKTMAPTMMALDQVHRNEHFDAEALQKAVDGAFNTPADAPAPRNTLATLVLHDNVLVAERYAPGVTSETPLPGWSMTKSVTAVLAGILSDRKGIDLAAPGALPLWRALDDPRSQISLDDLLRMVSGLALTERNDGFDENSRMLFLESDMAAYAASRPLQYPVADHYEYMSGNTVLAMARLQEIVGDGLAGMHGFMTGALFAPLGMSTAVMEPDQRGTFVGSSYMLASARDWARFGQLIVDGGRSGEAPVISAERLADLTRATPQSGDIGYGAGFWVSDARAATRGILPSGTLFAWGFQGQFIFMMPQERLVIVRLGATNQGAPGAVEFAAAVAAALKP